MKTNFVHKSMQVVIRCSFTAILAVSFSARAQYYEFEHVVQPYQEFNDGDQLDAAQMSSSEYFDTIIPDFEVSVMGKTTNELVVHESFILWERTALGESTQVFPLWYMSQIIPATEISYKTTGTAGNRILKVQYKDLGFLNNSNPAYYTNFQVWFYEGEDKLEFHYGPRNILGSGAYIDDGDGGSCPGAFIILADIYNEDEPTPESGHVINTAADPQYEQFFQSTTCDYQGMPDENDVYRFYRTSLGLAEQAPFTADLSKVNDHTLLVEVDNNLVRSVTVYSMDGKIIQSINQLNQSQVIVDLQSTASGVLFVEIVNQYGISDRKKIHF
jgi:hypothetical protein